MQGIFLSCIFIKILLNAIIVTVYKGGQYEISLG